GHALPPDGSGKVGVLGEEAVAGVHRIGAAALDELQDLLGVEVALGRRLPAERVRLVREPHVQRVAVEIGVDGDARDAELTTRPDDSDGDLTPVGDQDLGEHGPYVYRRVGRRRETT